MASKGILGAMLEARAGQAISSYKKDVALPRPTMGMKEGAGAAAGYLPKGRGKPPPIKAVRGTPAQQAKQSAEALADRKNQTKILGRE